MDEIEILERSADRNFSVLVPIFEKKKSEIKLDSKGRFLIPKEKRAVFGDAVVIIKRGDYFLFLTKKKWNQFVQKKLIGLKAKELRKMQRLLGSSAFFQTINKEGIILIPNELRKEVRNVSI